MPDNNYLHDNKIGFEKQIIWFVYKHCFHFRNDQSPSDKISWFEETWKVMYWQRYLRDWGGFFML